MDRLDRMGLTIHLDRSTYTDRMGIRIHLGDAALWRATRARALADGVAAQAVVTKALEQYLGRPSGPGGRVTAPVSPSELPSGPVRVTPTKAALVTAVERVAPGTVVGATAAPRCRRCGHGQAQHQPACSWMGCVCARFLETATARPAECP
jgi:hypothetical protein